MLVKTVDGRIFSIPANNIAYIEPVSKNADKNADKFSDKVKDFTAIYLKFSKDDVYSLNAIDTVEELERIRIDELKYINGDS